MVTKTYSVSLDEEVVDEAKKKMKKYGGKLSPIINNFLMEWNKKEEKK